VTGWKRVLFAGVGGQGVLLAGRCVGDAAVANGLEAVVGQVHGMSQRGGAVQAAVAIGGARSWEVPNGMADALVGLEPLELARALVKVSKRTTVIANTRPVLPASLQSAGTPYPPLASLLGPVGEAAGALTAVDASALASQAGSPRSLNVVMLGMLAATGVLPFPGESLQEAVLAVAGPGLERIHREAFRLGREVMRSVAST
jgi:indolepyruvate ferredoxin oxidoreductase beta subunit